MANPYGSKTALQLGFFLWELDTLAREVILHCDENKGQTVQEWKQVAIAIHKLKDAENHISSITNYDIFSEMTRIAHRQFHWQQGISHNDLNRTRKLYRSAGMNDAVRDVYGLSSEEVALAGFAALATYLEHFAMTDEWSKNVSKILNFDPSSVIANLATDFQSIKRSTLEARSLNENWAYAFNPLWLHPLIILDGGSRIVCPMPGLLARRMSEGLYYDIAGHDVDVLSANMGPAFQNYIGEALERSNRGNFTILSAQPYGSKSAIKDAVDWIVSDNTASLFIEVKILKMGRAAKEYLAPDTIVLVQLRKLAKAISQIYATLLDALADNYPHWKPDGRPVHPIVVTLDTWNLFTHTSHDILTRLVGEMLESRGIDKAVIHEHQYVICCANELEVAIQVMHEVGIETVMKDITSGEKLGWMFSGYLRSSFADESAAAVSLFPEERDKFFSRVI